MLSNWKRKQLNWYPKYFGKRAHLLRLHVYTSLHLFHVTWVIPCIGECTLSYWHYVTVQVTVTVVHWYIFTLKFPFPWTPGSTRFCEPRRVCTPKQHFDQFSGFCTAYPCSQHGWNFTAFQSAGNAVNSAGHVTCEICSSRLRLCMACRQCSLMITECSNSSSSRSPCH